MQNTVKGWMNVLEHLCIWRQRVRKQDCEQQKGSGNDGGEGGEELIQAYIMAVLKQHSLHFPLTDMHCWG